MSAPRSEARNVRGWRTEFKCWWKMAKYVDVVFDKSRNQVPGSTSICRDCCQVVFTRTCTGETELSAIGCRFHRNHPDIPFAVKSAITSVRLREMLRPTMSMALFYIDAGTTNLMDVSWVKQIREENDETNIPKNHYCHGETCLYGKEPSSIVQGKGMQGIYFKRCDDRYVNAIGEELHHDRYTDGDLLTKLALEPDEKKLAELAWRRHNPDDELDDDDETRPKKKFQCMVM